MGDLSQAEIHKQQQPPQYAGPLLSLSGVERTFIVGDRELHILKGIDLEIERSKLIMMRGRSGSGKTTLLNLMGGLDLPTKGSVMFQGNPIHEWDDEQRTEIRRKK